MGTCAAPALSNFFEWRAGSPDKWPWGYTCSGGLYREGIFSFGVLAAWSPLFNLAGCDSTQATSKGERRKFPRCADLRACLTAMSGSSHSCSWATEFLSSTQAISKGERGKFLRCADLRACLTAMSGRSRSCSWATEFFLPPARLKSGDRRCQGVPQLVREFCYHSQLVPTSVVARRCVCSFSSRACVTSESYIHVTCYRYKVGIDFVRRLINISGHL